LAGVLGREDTHHSKPVLFGSIALADGNKTTNTGLRVQGAVVVFRGRRQIYIVTMAHMLRHIIIEKAIITAFDKRGATPMDLGKAHPRHHQPRGQPRGVDKGYKMAGPLEGGGVIV